MDFYPVLVNLFIALWFCILLGGVWLEIRVKINHRAKQILLTKTQTFQSKLLVVNLIHMLIGFVLISTIKISKVPVYPGQDYCLLSFYCFIFKVLQMRRETVLPDTLGVLSFLMVLSFLIFNSTGSMLQSSSLVLNWLLFFLPFPALGTAFVSISSAFLNLSSTSLLSVISNVTAVFVVISVRKPKSIYIFLTIFLSFKYIGQLQVNPNWYTSNSGVNLDFQETFVIKILKEVEVMENNNSGQLNESQIQIYTCPNNDEYKYFTDFNQTHSRITLSHLSSEFVIIEETENKNISEQKHKDLKDEHWKIESEMSCQLLENLTHCYPRKKLYLVEQYFDKMKHTNIVAVNDRSTSAEEYKTSLLKDPVDNNHNCEHVSVTNSSLTPDDSKAHEFVDNPTNYILDTGSKKSTNENDYFIYTSVVDKQGHCTVEALEISDENFLFKNFVQLNQFFYSIFPNIAYVNPFQLKKISLLGFSHICLSLPVTEVSLINLGLTSEKEANISEGGSCNCDKNKSVSLMRQLSSVIVNVKNFFLSLIF